MIEIYCAVVCVHEGQLAQASGGGLVLLQTDEFGRMQTRQFGFDLGNSSILLAGLQVCRLAFASILPPFRAQPTILNLENQEVATILKSKLTTLGYNEQIAELRRWQSYYPNLTINVLAGPDDSLVTAKKLAQRALDTKRHSDSLTSVL